MHIKLPMFQSTLNYSGKTRNVKERMDERGIMKEQKGHKDTGN